jgi:AraC-like DNA-binding protein
MDQLSPFFARFTLFAHVFYSGRLCGSSGDHQTERAGHLHVLRSGKLQILQPGRKPRTIEEPSALFYPRPMPHRFQADEAQGADLVCARVELGAGMLNPLVISMPEMLVVPLASAKALTPAADLLFAEAFGEELGREAAVDRLSEYFLVLLLRAALNEQVLKCGVLNGLGDPRISKAMAAMHAHPERPWSLNELASLAGMSRPRFAQYFHEVVGVTPFSYLTDWRIGVAQHMLRKGEPLKMVAPAVGYSASTAFSRAFSDRIGVSPMEWLTHDRARADG